MLKWLVPATLLFVLATASPSWAVVVTIEAAAPVEDKSSEASIAQALRGALNAAIQRAVEMGMEWVQFQGAKLLGDKVIVRMIATDEDMEDRETTPATSDASYPRTI